MLKKCPIWSIFKYHRSSKGVLFLAVAKQVHKILVAYFGQICDLKQLLSELDKKWCKVTPIRAQLTVKCYLLPVLWFIFFRPILSRCYQAWGHSNLNPAWQGPLVQHAARGRTNYIAEILACCFQLRSFQGRYTWKYDYIMMQSYNSLPDMVYT